MFESDVEPEGGVNRLPLLTLDVAVCCIALKVFDREGYFSCAMPVANGSVEGGGNSNCPGRFDAACLLAVRLGGALSASREEPMCKG